MSSTNERFARPRSCLSRRVSKTKRGFESLVWLVVVSRQRSSKYLRAGKRFYDKVDNQETVWLMTLSSKTNLFWNCCVSQIDLISNCWFVFVMSWKEFRSSSWSSTDFSTTWFTNSYHLENFSRKRIEPLKLSWRKHSSGVKWASTKPESRGGVDKVKSSSNPFSFLKSKGYSLEFGVFNGK